MKLSFKNIVVIFLIALLGGSLGTIATQKLLYEDAPKSSISENVTITTVDYSNFEPSNLSETIEKAINTVVEIQCTVQTTSYFGQSTGYALGSGVIISNDGYIVTNNHVVENAVDLTVYTYGGDEYPGTIIGVDPRSDLAVVKIDGIGLPYSSFANSDSLILGEQVVAIGNPLGEGITCSEGIVSSLSKEVTIDDISMDLLQTSAAVNEGNSGGGLFDINANIIGVVNAKSSSNGSASVEGMGYAIPSNTVRKIVGDIIEHGYVKDRATMGISVYKNSSFYYSNATGCIVSDVVEGGAAELAGIKVGDVIVRIDDDEITSYTDLTKVLDKHLVGDQIEVTVKRGRNERVQTFTVTLQEAIN